jgi:hypothetical protein
MEETKDLPKSISVVDMLPLPRLDEAWVHDHHTGFGASPTELSTPLNLDTFVKLDSRATERLIAKEYEVLDMSGKILKGREASRDLRRSPRAHSMNEDNDDDYGFELI